jgi:hypothetical protein
MTISGAFDLVSTALLQERINSSIYNGVVLRLKALNATATTIAEKKAWRKQIVREAGLLGS